MKKIITAFSILVILFILVSCNGNGLSGTYVSEGGKYTLIFKSDGTCIWEQTDPLLGGIIFFDGSYEKSGSKYSLFIRSNNNRFQNRVLEAMPLEDGLLISDGTEIEGFFHLQTETESTITISTSFNPSATNQPGITPNTDYPTNIQTRSVIAFRAKTDVSPKTALDNSNFYDFFEETQIEIENNNLNSPYVLKDEILLYFGNQYNPIIIKKGSLLTKNMLKPNQQKSVLRYAKDFKAGDYLPWDIIDHRGEYFIDEIAYESEISSNTSYAFRSRAGWTFSENVKAGDYVLDSDFLDTITIYPFCEFELQDDNTYAVSLVHTIITDIKIDDNYALPRNYNGLPCTTLKRFESFQIRNVVIPSSYTTIESNAFYYSSNLQTITIQGNPIIGTNAFDNCRAEIIYENSSAP